MSDNDLHHTDRTTVEDSQSMRNKMVTTQLLERGIEDTCVLAAMRSVPREHFIPDEISKQAYSDSALPIGEGQTISQPYIVALMTELATLKGDEKVLEIGTGSGYGAAILSRIARHVYTIELNKKLALKAKTTLSNLEYENVSVISGDGSVGLPEHAPYDAILVTAGAPSIPQKLKEQLAIDGRLIIPSGSEKHLQYLKRLTHKPDGTLKEEQFGAVAFVPLTGEYGWPERKAL